MNTLYARTVTFPIGALRLVADDHGLLALDLPGLAPRHEAVTHTAPHPVLDQAESELRRYFAGELKRFQTPLRPEGTAFQRMVWEAVAAIAHGETTSYAVIASALGRPKAVRAVGHANGRNPLPLFIPCHRVIGSDGSLTGYAGGVSMKQRLLALEGAQPSLIAS